MKLNKKLSTDAMGFGHWDDGVVLPEAAAGIAKDQVAARTANLPIGQGDSAGESSDSLALSGTGAASAERGGNRNGRVDQSAIADNRRICHA